MHFSPNVLLLAYAYPIRMLSTIILYVYHDIYVVYYFGVQTEIDNPFTPKVQ